MKLTRSLAILGIALLCAAALVALIVGPVPAPGLLSFAALADPNALSLLPLALGATKTKFFRVATEGATTDGRAISRDWIDQMAKNFNRAKYGARVWLEHYRGISPDGLFKAYGDVLALESRSVEDGKKALFAQIEPLPELVAMNKAGQKIYTSIEVDPKFAGTGEAYMVGLAVTDSPASIGTEVLAFAQQHPAASPFAARKASPDNLFSAAEEAAIELEADEAKDDGKFSAKIKDIVAGLFGKKAAGDDAKLAALVGGIEAMAAAVTEKAAATDQQLAAFSTAQTKTAADLTALQTQFADLIKRLDAEPSQSHSQRPAATGGSGAVLTDC